MILRAQAWSLRVFSWVFILAMLFSLFPFAAFEAKAAPFFSLDSSYLYCQTVYPGDRVKFGSHPAVFLINDSGEMLPFPSADVYKTWFDDFSGIIQLDPKCADRIPSPKQPPYFVAFRPGTRLVKRRLSPYVYVVGEGGNIFKLKDENAARELFGNNWGQYLRDVDDTSWINFTDTGEQLDGSKAVDGMLVSDAFGSETFLVRNGELVPVEGEISRGMKSDIRRLPARVLANHARAFSTRTDREEILLGAGNPATRIHFPLQQEIIAKMLRATNSIESVEYLGTFAVRSTDGAESLNLNVEFRGASDYLDPAHAKSSLYFRVPMPEGTGYPDGAVAMEFRTFNNVNSTDPVDSLGTIYFRIAELPDVESFIQDIYSSTVRPDMPFLRGNWVKVDVRELARQYLDEADIREIKQELELLKGPGNNLREFDDSTLERLIQAGVLRVTAVHDNEWLGGTDTHVLDFEIDRPGLLQFMMALSRSTAGVSLDEREVKHLRRQLKNWGDIGGRLWVGTEDFLPRAINVRFAAQDSSTRMQFELNESFARFNKPLSIEPPLNSVGVIDWFEKIKAEFTRVMESSTLYSNISDNSFGS
ncbi:hypothetical protein H6758_03405 [Candidatus Nomurabacteria bacterium]|nr:hypothetical protein [Candidatus Nomurabacteria bacterium]